MGSVVAEETGDDGDGCDEGKAGLEGKEGHNQDDAANHAVNKPNNGHGVAESFSCHLNILIF